MFTFSHTIHFFNWLIIINYVYSCGDQPTLIKLVRQPDCWDFKSRILQIHFKNPPSECETFNRFWSWLMSWVPSCTQRNFCAVSISINWPWRNAICPIWMWQWQVHRITFHVFPKKKASPLANVLYGLFRQLMWIMKLSSSSFSHQCGHAYLHCDTKQVCVMDKYLDWF